MIKQMNYKTFGLFALILLLASCSGWKKTSESTFKTSSTNVNVDTGPIKVRGDDNSSSIKIFGKEIKSSKKKEQFFPENPKQFINGDVCKYCDYIGRTENEQGNLIEVEIEKGFKNGEEREYSDGKIIRSSYYADGRRSGMEYYYSEGKVVDSAYAETIFGSEWNIYKANAALPDPVAKYISREYFQDKALGLYAFLLGNEKISQIARYNEVETDIAEKGTFTPIIKIFYDNHQDFSNFKVVFIKPFHEEMIFKNNELVERKKIKGDKTVLEFRQGEFFKEFYDNGTAKKLIMGDITSMTEENTEQCKSTCQSQWFFENGSKHKENFYVDGQLKQEKEWNENGILTFDCKFDLESKNGFKRTFYSNGKPHIELIYENGVLTKATSRKENGIIDDEIESFKSRRTYYDNGQLKDEQKGDVHLENDIVVMQNGTYKKWFSNGILAEQTMYNKGLLISQQLWDSTGFMTYDYERNKHVKAIENTTPIKRKEWVGGVVANGKDFSFISDVVGRGYQGDILIYEYRKEGYDSTSNTFKKELKYDYDSTGTKTKERVYQNNKAILQKLWVRQDPLKPVYFLQIDYNANTHFKICNEPKKIFLEFKGKSEWTGDNPDYIDGSLAFYTPNGKKNVSLIWKNGRVKSGKIWSKNNGVLIAEFDSEKYAKFFSEETKKLALYFKGSSQCEYPKGNFIYIDGSLEEFDESGKLVSTEIYKDGILVDKIVANH